MKRCEAIEAERAKRMRKSKELAAFIAMLKKQSSIATDWNERLWITLLETATVYCDGRIEFCFKSGFKDAK